MNFMLLFFTSQHFTFDNYLPWVIQRRKIRRRRKIMKKKQKRNTW